MRWAVLVGMLICGCGRVDFAVRGDAAPGDALPTDTSSDTAADAIDAQAANIIDLNGGSSWNGWTMVGDSLGAGRWVRGATDRAYTIYTTDVHLSAAQTVTAPTLTQGDPGDGAGVIGDTSDLFAGNWQAGDHVIGIGLAYGSGTTMTRLFVQLDYDTTNIVPASAVGAADGVVSFDTGDTTSFFTSEIGPGDRFREYQYAVFTAFTPDGSSNFTLVYGPPPLPTPPSGPSRSLAVLAPGSTQLAQSVQVLHNFDAAARLESMASAVEGPCSATTRISFEEGDFINSTKTSMQNFLLGACP